VATKIRLKRLGKIRTPHYRVVVMDSRTKRDGRPIEEIGQYHPKSDPSEIIIDSERAQYWLGVGAQPTEAVVALLKRTGDWQKFTGDDSIPSGIVPQPTKPNKLDLFNAALAEANDEPTSGAVTKSKRSKKSEEAKAEEAVAEEAPAEESATEAAPQAVAEEAPAEEAAAE
jgi:small subunit ribosomal protein S16